MNKTILEFYKCYFKYDDFEFLKIFIPGIKGFASYISIQELFERVKNPMEQEDSLWTTRYVYPGG